MPSPPNVPFTLQIGGEGPSHISGVDTPTRYYSAEYGGGFRYDWGRAQFNY
eukprot:gene38374-40601_t